MNRGQLFIWGMLLAGFIMLAAVFMRVSQIAERLEGDARYQSCMADVLNSADDSVERMDRCRVHLPAP